MIRTDALFTQVKQEIYDAVILPGGLKGAEAFAAVR
jgi:putative intracellular protease/amidase